MKLVTVRISEAQIEGIDDLTRMEMYPSRSAAIRAAIRDLMRRELWGAEPPIYARLIICSHPINRILTNLLMGREPVA